MSELPSIKAPGWVNDFKNFIMRGNVLSMAVGIVIGSAFTAIVNSVVSDLITPLIGFLTGGIDFSNMFCVLKGPHLATLAQSKAAGAVTINYGSFLNTLIQFLIISFFIFWVMRIVGKLSHADDKKAAAAPAPEVTLLTEIRDLLAKRK